MARRARVPGGAGTPCDPGGLQASLSPCVVQEPHADAPLVRLCGSRYDASSSHPFPHLCNWIIATCSFHRFDLSDDVFHALGLGVDMYPSVPDYLLCYWHLLICYRYASRSNRSGIHGPRDCNLLITTACCIAQALHGVSVSLLRDDGCWLCSSFLSATQFCLLSARIEFCFFFKKKEEEEILLSVTFWYILFEIRAVTTVFLTNFSDGAPSCLAAVL